MKHFLQILVKKNPQLNTIIRRVNDLLQEKRVKNKFHFISTTDYGWKDGIRLHMWHKYFI